MAREYDNIADAVSAVNGEVAEQSTKIANILEALEGKGGGGGVENVEWHQCPTAVKAYLDYVSEHPYDADDYTYTCVTDFAPVPAVVSNTKPIGKTVDGVTYYNEVPNIKTPFSTQNKAGTLKPLNSVRWINSLTSNMRDLGGWSCDGGTVKYGLLYRSADINSADRELFVEIGITKELDLTHDGIEAFEGIEYIDNGAAPMYSLTPISAWHDNLRAIFDAAIYRQPLVFHCAMGADRTGTLACVIEGLLGVSQSDIDKDYELTSFYYAYRARNGSYQGGATWAGLIAQINALNGSTFRDKCVNFVASLGFTAAEINAFRKAMIDGNPEIVTPTTSRLPNEYQEVEWIQTDGTATIQIPFDSTFVGAYIEQKIMRVGNGVRGLIGSASSNSATIRAGAGSYFGWNSNGYYEMGGTSISNIQSTTTDFDTCKFEWTATGSGKLTVNGVEATQRSGSDANSKWNIFGGSTYPATCKQKECKVYNISGGGTMTAHLVPCYRKTDSVIGMYDLVNKTFLINIASSGTFTKGGDVT